ncbi:MAG: hypothetical protein JO048_08640 [Methylobacteriaceae bacterium]|nr:hypothetical protein [Methylobacteriaceae bacterium]
MRDILTVLAGLVILCLAAALAVPPLLNWSSHRGLVEAVLSRAAGVPVATEGELTVRLLPTPRLSAARLKVDPGDPELPRLDAVAFDAELALTPLLHGEWRILEARAAQVAINVAGSGEGWRLPPAAVRALQTRREGAIERFEVGTLRLFRAGAGASIELKAVRGLAQTFAGPWRVEGRYRSVPFELAIGEIGLDLSATAKLGSELAAGRLALDLRLLPERQTDGALLFTLAGGAKFAAAPGPGGAPFPLLLQTGLKASSARLALDDLAIELGEAGALARLTGSGRFTHEDGRLKLDLDGRRLDLGSLLTESGRLTAWRPSLPVPVDVTTRLESVAFAGEEFTGVSLGASLEGSRLTADRVAFAGPGLSQVALSGELDLSPGGAANGHVRVQARSAERVAATLREAGLDHPALALLDGRPLDGEADLALAGPVTSVRNLRVELGDALLTGLVRYTGPDGSSRPRLDAQLALRNLDLASLPAAGGLDLGRGLDLGLTLDARGLRYGPGGGTGQLRGRITSDGPSLIVERLDIVDLAGANGTLAGRIAPDGTGRIAGRLTSRQAGTLIDLVGRPWLGPLAAYVPGVIRTGALDLEVAAERAASGANGTAVRTSLKGTIAGGLIDGEVVTEAGRTRSLAMTLATERVASWLGLLGQAGPGRLEIKGQATGENRLAVTLAGDVGPLAMRTGEPIVLAEKGAALVGGAGSLTSPDLRPLLALAGPGVAPPNAVPVDLALRLVPGVGAPRLAIKGEAGGASVSADLAGSLGDVSGAITVDRLSLPWLASALALRAAPGAGATWSAARFGPADALLVARAVKVRAGSLELGSGFAAREAGFELASGADGLAIRGLDAAFADGRLAGSLTLARQGGLASLSGEMAVRDVGLTSLVGGPVRAGRLSGELRFGASGESPAALVANLGGAGTASLGDVTLASADPTGLVRAAGTALRADDPLPTARLASLAAAETDKAPLASRGPATASIALTAGILRASPLTLAGEDGSWSGAAAFDLRTGTIDWRGLLSARQGLRGWPGDPPQALLAWTGPAGAPTRNVGAAPLATGLAQAVLARELERIDTFEQDAAERARLNGRLDLDRARRAAEEAAARKAADDAARHARAREEAERRTREDAERRARDGAGTGAAAGAPLDIRPPAQAGATGG